MTVDPPTTYHIRHSGWYNTSSTKSILVTRLCFSRDPGNITVSVRQSNLPRPSPNRPGKVTKVDNPLYRNVFFHVAGHDPLEPFGAVSASFMFTVIDQNGNVIGVDPSPPSIDPVDPATPIEAIEIDPCDFTIE